MRHGQSTPGVMSGHVRAIPVSLGARALNSRWLVRSPIWLYRVGLRFVFGTRVVLEVVDRIGRDEYVVASGFGQRARWYRNVIAQPAVRVSCGLRCRVPALARPLRDREAVAVLRRYATRHPRAWSSLRSAIEAVRGQPVRELSMASLRLSPGRRPRPRRGRTSELRSRASLRRRLSHTALHDCYAVSTSAFVAGAGI